MTRTAIVGGGIAGLTAAIYLTRRRVEVAVYERAAEFAPVGAGIMLSPNALQVLDSLGLSAHATAAGVSLDEFLLTDASLRPLHRLSAEWCRARFGHGLVTLRRSALHAVLVAGAGEGVVRLGKELASLDATHDTVHLRFTDGSAVEADQVIGADGISSRVRSSLFGDVELRYSGQTCFRGLVPFELPSQYSRKGLEIWGRRFRLGFACTGPDEVYYFCVTDAPSGTTHSADEARRWMLDGLADFPTFVQDLVEATPDDTLIQTDLYDFKPLPRWSVGAVGLMGDAAHATTPNLGQGGAQAIEDGYHLDAGVDPTTGRIDWERFHRQRRKKTAAVTNLSYRFGKLAHTRRLKWLRNRVLRATPQWVARRQTVRIMQL